MGHRRFQHAFCNKDGGNMVAVGAHKFLNCSQPVDFGATRCIFPGCGSKGGEIICIGCVHGFLE